MQAEDQGAGGMAEDAESQSIAAGPGSHEGHGGGGRGAEGGGAPVVRALNAPGPGRNALPGPSLHAGPPAGRPGRLVLKYTLRVPFTSPEEAQRTLEALVRHARPLPRAVRKELILFGKILIIRLSAEDPEQMGISLCSCLRDLDQLIPTMKRISRSCLKRG
uniref:Cancer/testis antigen 1A n=1 Tax=Myotis myotis TaxID=51298 RepID=A0A7J7YCB5_MYOMY|nr:cancer/testis antigen 1A [Myotis myotis]